MVVIVDMVMPLYCYYDNVAMTIIIMIIVMTLVVV